MDQKITPRLPLTQSQQPQQPQPQTQQPMVQNTTQTTVPVETPVKWGYWIATGLILIIVVLIIAIVNLVQKDDKAAPKSSELDKYEGLTNGKEKKKKPSKSEAKSNEQSDTSAPQPTEASTNSSNSSQPKPILYNPITVL